MKKILLAVCGVAALGFGVGSANAQSADWSGWYAGLHAGYGSSDVDWTFGALVGGGASDRGTPGQNIAHTSDGFIGGVHVGYNTQVGAWVYGAEAAVTGSGMNGASLSTFGAGDDTYTTDIDWLVGAFAKAGYAFDNVLIYAKGGYTGASVETTISDTVGIAATGSSREWHHGYAVGAGVDVMVTSNLIIGAEYRFSDFGSEAHTIALTAGEFVTDAVEFQTHSLMLNASWKF